MPVVTTIRAVSIIELIQNSRQRGASSSSSEVIDARASRGCAREQTIDRLTGHVIVKLVNTVLVIIPAIGNHSWERGCRAGPVVSAEVSASVGILESACRWFNSV